MNAYKKYKNRLEKFLQTERGKRFINFAYSIGAAIVILGAMFKLLHFPFGNELLFIGMVTEVIVFTLSAFDTPIRDYNWDRVFPALTVDNVDHQEKSKAGDYTAKSSPTSLTKSTSISNSTSLSSTNQSYRHSSEFSEANIDLSPQANEYAKQMESLKNETERMAQQLKELNEVYARMLKAMSTNRDH